MELRELSNGEIESVYNNHMLVDFPPGELKPLDVIQKHNKRKNYMGYGLYENEKLLAYAFLAASKSYLLIDYYSVCDQYRNKGIGSEFLNMLKEQCKKYNGIIVEVEKVECADGEAEKVERERRIKFYEKNGMRMTGVSSILFNVNYSIMCLCNIELKDSDIYQGLKNIYNELIPSVFHSKYVEIICEENIKSL